MIDCTYRPIPAPKDFTIEMLWQLYSHRCGTQFSRVRLTHHMNGTGERLLTEL